MHMHMQEFYRLFENGLLITRRSLASEASKLKLVYLYFCCYALLFIAIIYWPYYLLICLPCLSLWPSSRVECCSKIFASLFLAQEYLSLSIWYRIDFSSNKLQWFWHLCQLVFIPVSFSVKESKCGSWGGFSTTCKAQRRFQNALMIHLNHDENYDTVEVTLTISVPSGAFLANFKGS